MTNIQEHINKIADELMSMEKFKELGEFETYVNNTPDDVICPKCGFVGVYQIEKQTRAADENATVVRICLKCHYKWSVI